MSDSYRKDLKETRRFWEGKRLLYNGILVIYSTFFLYSFWDYPVRKILGIGNILLETLELFLILNVLYTLMWAYKIPHLKNNHQTSGYTVRRRWIVFSLYTLFSGILIEWFHTFQLDVMFAY